LVGVDQALFWPVGPAVLHLVYVALLSALFSVPQQAQSRGHNATKLARAKQENTTLKIQ